MDTGKVVLGVLAGAAAGALLGILFAPDKGSVTRKKIVDKKDSMNEDLKAKFNEIIDSLSHQFEQAKDGIKDSHPKDKASATV